MELLKSHTRREVLALEIAYTRPASGLQSFTGTQDRRVCKSSSFSHRLMAPVSRWPRPLGPSQVTSPPTNEQALSSFPAGKFLLELMVSFPDMLPALGQVSGLSLDTQGYAFPECCLWWDVREWMPLSSLPRLSWHTHSSGLGGLSCRWTEDGHPESILVSSYAQTCYFQRAAGSMGPLQQRSTDPARKVFS